MATKKPTYTVASWPRTDADLGPLLTSKEAADLLGISETELNRLQNDWKVIGLHQEADETVWVYPARQFVDGAVHPSVEPVVARLCTRMGPRTIAAVLNTRVSDQGDGTHWDMLLDNPEDLMVSWAATVVGGYNYMEPENH